jgi:hypothetical protein
MTALVIVVFVIAVAISTVIFAVSLFLIEDIQASSFKEFGMGPTLARCAGLVVVVSLIGLIPYGWVMALVVWFVGIMFMFQKTFVQTLILTILNNIVTISVAGALEHKLS